MYKILLLTDFSAASRHAIAFTQALFSNTAADFCLLSACPVADDLVMDYAGNTLLIDRWQATEKSLKALQQSITQAPFPHYHSYRSLAVLGQPTAMVNQLLLKEPFDLVVVGATGSGWSELLGSVATDVVREAQTNVLVVPESAPIRPLNQVVLATDYRSVNDAQSVAILTDLISRKAAQLTILTVENPDRPETHSSDLSRQYVHTALGNYASDPYIIHDTDVLHGLNEYLKTHRVDMLVMLPHHRSLFDVFRHRSVSRSFAFHPSVPLLTIYDAPGHSSVDLDRIPYVSYLD